jgi:hypothetical protein
MSADCARCPAEADVPPRGAAHAAAGLTLASGLLAALLPKCPICLVAYLSVFGVTLGAASLTLAVLRPLLLTLAVLALASTVLRRRASQARLRTVGSRQRAVLH